MPAQTARYFVERVMSSSESLGGLEKCVDQFTREALYAHGKATHDHMAEPDVIAPTCCGRTHTTGLLRSGRGSGSAVFSPRERFGQPTPGCLPSTTASLGAVAEG